MPVSKRTAGQATTATGPAPYWRSDCGRATVYVNDNLDIMSQMEPGQFHAIVTDPPYGLEFMGKKWDAPWKQNGSTDARQRRAAELGDLVKAKCLRHNTTYGTSDSVGFQEWFLARAGAMLRVAKPGAHLLSFGGTRMWHRMACAVEDAGWEIRDTVMWVYGSGFPKSHDISKAIDKALGAEREVVGTKNGLDGSGFGNVGHGLKSTEIPVTAPATDAARQWSGWGTCLKPAVEPIVLARRPMGTTVARCAIENGTGGLNVDACRVNGTGEDVTRLIQSKSSSGSGVYQFNSGEAGSQSMVGGYAVTHKDGRWPANLVHDGGDEKLCRYFYSAKADKDDRPHGNGVAAHPTVKPLDLMLYLVRLVCAPGGTVLDPFMGSGSTGCAAVAEGMRFVGIEQSREYADIAVGRLKLALAAVGGSEDTPQPHRRMRGA